MNLRKLSFYTTLAMAVCLASQAGIAQTVDTLERHWPRYISLHQYLQPFLTADTIHDETIMPIKRGDAAPNGSLLFPVRRVLSVRDAYLGTVYEEGVDWNWEGQRIVLTDSSRIPYFEGGELVYGAVKEGMSQPGSIPGTYVLFSEGELLRARQLAVTYVPEGRGASASKRLPAPSPNLSRTASKLGRSESLQVVFWGNSIEVGANSSGFQHVPPFMPNWAELFVWQLRKRFGAPVSYRNLAVGGQTAAWGVENVSQVLNENPDLVVIGFGMNDGTFGVPVDVFAGQIQAMIAAVRAQRPACEFIVITPMLANPASIQHNLQAAYRPALLELEGPGVAIADLTYWHAWLLTHKAYEDMTGNNINHPNDFLARWYAQILISLLVDSN